ncbi:MAG: hypothetical protein ACTSUF_02210 [Candidatus Heimdallarchaeaceae archaeon]
MYPYYCLNCGKKLSEEEIKQGYCSECGTEIGIAEWWLFDDILRWGLLW